MAMDKRDCIPIPQPPGYPLVGNISDVDPELPIQSLSNLADQYGEIFSLTTFGKKRVIITSQALANEVCDEKRFSKTVSAGLAELRHGIGDGLFTAHGEEENWGIAHRVLVPAFGPLNLADMFDDMKDVASQLVLKWARYGTDYKIPATDDFTRLTLDTLALCAMDHRFNSFYTEEQHPFIDAMVNFLRIGGSRARRPGYLAPFYRSEDQIFERDIKYMRDLSAELVQQRREQPKDGKKDLLNAMIKGTDPKTGKGLRDDLIINNMITFLIAGHETTSGLLSFLFYYLLKHPEACRKGQEEVDKVIGNDSIRLEHINKLHYVQAMLRETLRLQPTAPAFTVGAKVEGGEILGGNYHVEKGTPIAIALPKLHRDPAVYGEDAEEWKPERMLDEAFNQLPPNSWKPFGNGSRGCIGRPFAWQEAVLVTAMCLQYFNFEIDDPAYNLQIKSTLTIKPKDFKMKASLREGWTATKVEQSLSGSIRSGAGPNKKEARAAEQTKAKGKPFTVLYGSNSGTCESFAQTLAADAADHGFTASKVDTLDSAKQNLPSNEPVVIVTASYEGEPTDNAAHFFDWLSNLKDDEKTNVQYVVFGCGHSDWKLTHHKVPKAIDKMLSAHGGKSVCESGYADAAGGDMMGVFQEWEDSTFWPAMKDKFGGDDTDTVPASMGQNLDIEVFTKRASHLRADVSEAKVITAQTLTAPGVPEKKHIELELPSAMTFRAGDYLAVLPLNPPETVRRVMTRFGLPWDAMLNISSRTGTALPTDAPVSGHDLFSAYLELSQPATKRNIAMLIEASDADETRSSLQKLLDADYSAEITEKRTSLLTLLERFPSIKLPLSAFVASLIAMRVRQYSISSSPLADPSRLTLTYALLNTPSLSRPDEKHIGVASSYLSTLKAGDIVHVAIKPSHPSFHLPSDPTVPVIMICAGTGVAPFRGFIQERAVQIQAGRKLAPAHLYVGSRHPGQDALYADELDNRAQEVGAVVVHRAFSQAAERSNGHKHVDDAVRADAENLIELWDQGARVFVCGSREVGESVRRACLDVVRVRREKQGLEYDAEKAEKWFDGLRNERFSTDVFQ